MKYQNTSGFRQVLVIEGKKSVVFADDVVEVSHELFNPSFEKVDDSTEVTFKFRSIKKQSSDTDKLTITNFENQLEVVKKEASDASATKISELEESITKSATSQGSELSTLKKEFAEFKVLALKRFEILKNVIQTLEYEVGLLYPEEEVAEEPKSFR